jgi:cell division protein YceG involved in septum cleavage
MKDARMLIAILLLCWPLYVYCQPSPEPQPLTESLTESLYFSVLPGERIRDWCTRLEEQHLIKCSALEDTAIGSSYPLPLAAPPSRRFEGLFAPGTYLVHDPAAATPQDLIDLLLSGAEARLSLDPVHGLDANQQRTLASLVYKEAAHPTEYRRVAAVFLNRLRRDDRLGSCPALEYELGYHRPFLLFKDIDKAATSPYNLYRRVGLPPTPICFFDEQALEAVRHPDPDPTLYFFVRDWAKDKLVFAAEDQYDQHQENARRAKQNYRATYGDIRRLFPGVFYRMPSQAESANRSN